MILPRLELPALMRNFALLWDLAASPICAFDYQAMILWTSWGLLQNIRSLKLVDLSSGCCSSWSSCLLVFLSMLSHFFSSLFARCPLFVAQLAAWVIYRTLCIWMILSSWCFMTVFSQRWERPTWDWKLRENENAALLCKVGQLSQ